MSGFPNSDKYFKHHQVGHVAKDCTSSTMNTLKRGLCSLLPYDSPEKDTNSSTNGISEKDVSATTSKTAALLISDKFSICTQPRHLEKDYPSAIDINSREGTISFVTSDIIEKKSETISMPSKSNNCFKCQKPGHWSKNCPSRDSNSTEGHNSSSSYNTPQKICNCGRGPCVILTSNTVNNPGRKFYRCPSRECGFFEWCDGGTSHSKDHSPPERFGWQKFPSPTYTKEGCRRIVKDYDLSTRCPCGAGPCPVRTAKTQKNMGRQFVSCPVWKGEGSCGFFKWCDELDLTASSLSSVRQGSLFVKSKQDDSLGRNDT